MIKKWIMIKIGHRGAMGYAPENTLRSFSKALELGVDMIELDVYACKSGELVVIHDLKVDRTTNGKGYVEEKTLDELRILDAGEDERIPTLSEVIELVNRKVPINIELKGKNTAEKVSQIIQNCISKGWSVKDFTVSSFNHIELLRFKNLQPLIKIGALIYGIPLYNTASFKSLNPYSVNIDMDFINQEFVNDAHANNYKVYVYTVNDYDDIKRIKSLNVDGIFSNFPDRIT